MEIDYYKILKLASSATLVEIKKTYYQLALKCHPDKGGDAEKFKALADAYEILMDAKTKAEYDRERSTYSPVNSDDIPSHPNNSDDIPSSTMVFNTAPQTNPSSSTSVVVRNGTNLVASAGVKAEDMNVKELFNLAMASEYVALALAKNIEQLKRIPKEYSSSNSDASIWSLALKYPSFAYQILMRKETRASLYKNLYSFNLEKLLKNDYNLLLLITSSEELTQNLLYKSSGESNLTGTDLHDIYAFHLQNHGSCQAFDLLLESNKLLKLLFDNHKKLQLTNGQCALPQLNLLDFSELKHLALKNRNVAIMVINNSQLQNKFQYIQSGFIEILLAYPNLLINFFNNPERSFYLKRDAIVEGCKKSHAFLLCILNSPREANSLNGFDVEEIIGHDPKNLEHIYKNIGLNHKHINYLAFVKQLTDPSFSTTKAIYDSILKNFGAFDVYILLDVIEHLSKTCDHQLLAPNMRSFMKLYRMENDYCDSRLVKISLKFFCAIYDQKSFPSYCYKYVYEYCDLYFQAFEMLCQDPQALAQIGDEQLYDLQQKWTKTNERKVTEIFNKNYNLMQQWIKGYQIKKLQQNVVVANYEEQPALGNESESVVKIRLLILSLQHYLTFNNIIFSKQNYDVISWLFEQDWLSDVVAMHFKNEQILAGMFWFLAITDKPQSLNENLPIDFIIQQLELTINNLRQGKSIEVKWLIKHSTNKENQTLYHLYSISEQKELWFNDLLANINIQDKGSWIKLLQDNEFSNKVLEKEDCLEKLSVLNWECPTYRLQELGQDRLINYVIHLISNYPDPGNRVRLLSESLMHVQDLNRLFPKLSTLNNLKQVDIYLILLQQGQLTLINFLQNNKNLALLREFPSLQEYFIAHHNEEKDALFTMIDSHCKQKLYGDALTVFSLMYQSKLEDKIDAILLNYFEMQPFNNVYTKGLIVIGLLGMLTAISFILVFNLPPVILLSALAASMVLVMVGVYQLTEKVADKVVNISYREALSRRNVAMFFKPADETLPPSTLRNEKAVKSVPS